MAAQTAASSPRSSLALWEPNKIRQSFVEILDFHSRRMKGKYFRILCLIAGCGAFLFMLPATINARDRGPYDAGYEQGYYDGYHHGYRDATSGQEYDNHWPDGYDDFEEGVHDGRHAGYDAGYREGRERYRHHRDDDPD
jgi:hypothetical protein